MVIIVWPEYISTGLLFIVSLISLCILPPHLTPQLVQVLRQDLLLSKMSLGSCPRSSTLILGPTLSHVAL